VKAKKTIPPVYFLVLLLVSISLGTYLPVLKIVRFPYTYLGVAPIVVGVVSGMWAGALFRKHKTTVKPHETPSALMTSGVFRISRNPIYSGMLLILFGVSIWVGSITAFVSPLVFFLIINRRFIPMEESALETVFGGRYLEYKRRVRRWV
jgi:protein-S-isoprenylcysteine O-methyltransferase Ste14